MLSLEQKIEFIREKVVMANNLKYKTYKKALENEIQLEGCIVKFKSKDNATLLGAVKKARYTQKAKERTSIVSMCDNELFKIDLSYSTKNIISDYTILGLPLTLERVLIALYRYNIYKTHIKKNTFSLEIILNKKIFLLCFQLSKTLENQSQETIEKIYELLN